jgi:hypothetical protein
VLGFLLAVRQQSAPAVVSGRTMHLNEARLEPSSSNNWGSDLSAFATPAEIT